MRPTDIDAVLAVQRAAYGDDYQEAAEVLLDKWRIGAAWCHVVERASGCLGYVLAHPWRHDRVPPLHQGLEQASAPDCLFLHDLAIAPSGRGLGLGAELLGAVRSAAPAAFTRITLVSLGEAIEFWQCHGFEPIVMPGDAVDLSSYGAGACLMRRDFVRA